MNRIGLVALLAGLSMGAAGQEPGRVRVEVRAGGEPVAGATVVVASVTQVTDEGGIAVVPAAAGLVQVTVVHEGFVPVTVPVTSVENIERVVRIELEPELTIEEEVTVVASTRTGRRIEDQPMRVEALDREEIEEKMLMTPGDIVMMLNEMGGMRVQTTSPSLGAASVRIQGMRGRYTRFLSDGLPLYGSQPGGMGLLQIPPMDLGQVEVIKGVASAFHGTGAMGGVVNLLSRRPSDESEREVLFNRSTRGATDGVLWLSTPLSETWGMTLLGSVHRQDLTDVDGDGWADMAHYDRGVVRPRFFWDDGQGRSFFLTAGGARESRTGGTVVNRTLPATGASYREALDTSRHDVGVLWQTLAGPSVVTARAAFAQLWHDHTFGETLERDRRVTGFAELAVRRASGRHTWVAGAAVERDAYDPADVPRFEYAFTTPGFFVQDDVDVRSWLALSMSGRLDRHSEYGWFFSPRVSALLRSGDWSTRLSAGTGFFGPTPLTEEIEAAGLTRLTVDGPLQAERGRSVSIDLTRSQGPAAYTATFFGSRIIDPVHVDRSTYTLRNLDQPTTNWGMELLGTFRQPPFALTTTYTYVRSRERSSGVIADVAQTPRHSLGFVAMAENEDGRIGFELYRTGRQRLDANPYRDVSEPYTVAGVLVERRVGPLRLFVNLENLTDVRQQRWDPILRPDRAIDGRWTVDAWAPLDGRVINGGVRVQF
ncbi:MAG: TonB-dependent receptor [Acidobacteria bacterium]|nr:TonB-dependent receptor [Acidobacteriota bacterium]